MVALRQTGTIIVTDASDEAVESMGDVLRIFSDKVPFTVDEAREIRRAASVSSDKDRVYVVAQNSRVVSEEAQNVLLKTLEEGTAGVLVVFVVSSTEKLLKTIISRCDKLEFTVKQGGKQDPAITTFARGDATLASKLAASPQLLQQAKNELAVAKEFFTAEAAKRIQILCQHQEPEDTERLINDLLYVSSFIQINSGSLSAISGSRSQLLRLQDTHATVGSSLKLVHSQLIQL